MASNTKKKPGGMAGKIAALASYQEEYDRKVEESRQKYEAEKQKFETEKNAKADGLRAFGAQYELERGEALKKIAPSILKDAGLDIYPSFSEILADKEILGRLGNGMSFSNLFVYYNERLKRIASSIAGSDAVKEIVGRHLAGGAKAGRAVPAGVLGNTAEGVPEGDALAQDIAFASAAAGSVPLFGAKDAPVSGGAE